LEQTYRAYFEGRAVCRPRVDIEIPTTTPGKLYRWGTMEGGMQGGYFAIRCKSDIIYYEQGPQGATQEKYCVEPGTFSLAVATMAKQLIETTKIILLILFIIYISFFASL